MNVASVAPAIRRGPTGSVSVVPLPLAAGRGVGVGVSWRLIVVLAALCSGGCATSGIQRQYRLSQAGPPRTIALVGDRPLSITAGEPGRSIASTDRPNRFRLAGFPIGGGLRSNGREDLEREESGGSSARAETPRGGGFNLRRIGSSIEYGTPRGPVEVSGRVVSTTGRPVERVRVRVARLDDPDEPPRIIETDSQGRFTAKELTRDGEYSFVAELTTPEGRLTGRVVVLAPEPYVRIVLEESIDRPKGRSSSGSVASSGSDRASPSNPDSAARTRRAVDSDRSAVRIRAGSPDFEINSGPIRQGDSFDDNDSRAQGDWRDGTVRDEWNSITSRNQSRDQGWNRNGLDDDEGPNPLPPAIERPRGTTLAPADGFRDDALDSSGRTRRNGGLRRFEAGENESDWRVESEWGLRVQAIDWNDLREPLRWSSRERRPRSDDLGRSEPWSDRPVPTIFDNPPPPRPLGMASGTRRLDMSDPFGRSNSSRDESGFGSPLDSMFDELEQSRTAAGSEGDRTTPGSSSEPPAPPTRWGDLDWSVHSTHRGGSQIRSSGSSSPAARSSGAVGRHPRVADRVASRDDHVAPASAWDPTPRRPFDLTLSDLDGHSIALESLVEERADYVLIDFFGTWCDPCRVTIPRLIEWDSRFAGRLSVVGVAYERGGLEESSAKVKRAAGLMGISYPLALGRSEGTPVGQPPRCPLARWFEVDRFPTLVLLDRWGRVVWKGQGGRSETLDELDRVLTTLMR